MPTSLSIVKMTSYTEVHDDMRLGYKTKRGHDTVFLKFGTIPKNSTVDLVEAVNSALSKVGYASPKETLMYEKRFAYLEGLLKEKGIPFTALKTWLHQEDPTNFEEPD